MEPESFRLAAKYLNQPYYHVPHCHYHYNYYYLLKWADHDIKEHTSFYCYRSSFEKKNEFFKAFLREEHYRKLSTSCEILETTDVNSNRLLLHYALLHYIHYNKLYYITLYIIMSYKLHYILYYIMLHYIRINIIVISIYGSNIIGNCCNFICGYNEQATSIAEMATCD
jgi:hypothetical protein